MSDNESIYFNKYGEIVGKGYDGQNHYEQVILNLQQVKAIEMVIEKYNEQGHCQN